MVRAVDEELKITNAKLSDKIENKIDDVKFLKQLSPDLSALCPQTTNSTLIYWIGPILQSFSPGKSLILGFLPVLPMISCTATVVF